MQLHLFSLPHTVQPYEEWPAPLDFGGNTRLRLCGLPARSAPPGASSAIALDFELIMVNDHGPDNAWDIIGKLRAADNRAAGVDRPRTALLIFFSACAVVALIGAILLGIDFYALNRGFSFADDSYYALSYEMAAKSFYPHFTNTPFLVAFLFGWLKPSIIGYRAVHLALAISAAGLLIFAIVEYLNPPPRSKKILALALASFAICYVPYCYYLSAPTLSYNHLNEFLVLASESCLLLSAATRRSGYLCVLAGALSALDIYVKPPTCLLLESIDLLLIVIMFRGRAPWRREVPFFVLGSLVSLTMGTVFWLTPHDWSQYIDCLTILKSHSPRKMVITFLTSGWSMLVTSSRFTIVTLLLVAALRWWSSRLGRLGASRVFPAVILAGLAGALADGVVHILFKNGENTILGSWIGGWVYSSTIFVAISVVCLGSLLMILYANSSNNKKRLWLVVCVLAVNPIMQSIGTANGFGQVQLGGLSWFLLGAMLLFMLLEERSTPLLAFFSILTIASACVCSLHVIRLTMSPNALAMGSLATQTYKVPGLPALRHMRVDAQTRDTLVTINAILDRYPSSPTLAFFDMPGLQYVFGRDWVVRDPWLMNTDYPDTRNDPYNCGIITANPDALHNTIFLVTHEELISPPLRACLAKIGFPDGLLPLGTVAMPSTTNSTAVTLYLHP